MELIDLISALIDIPFYAEEAAVSFSSAREAAEHFLAVGQARDLSPSPFILWGWIRAANPGIADFRAFAAEPLRACAHPALVPSFYFDVCRAVGGNLAVLTTLLAQADLDRVQLLPRFADAVQALGYQSLRPLMVALSSARVSNPRLEMSAFSSAWYLDAYEDVRLSGYNPFRHYVVTGWREGVIPPRHFRRRPTWPIIPMWHGRALTP